MMDRLAFSTNAFTRFTLLQSIEKIAEAGYQAVEILADTPHAFATSLTPSQIEIIKSALERRKLRVSNINANTAMGFFKDAPPEPFFEPSIVNPDERLRRWRIDYTKKCLDLARELSAKCTSITSGKPLPTCPPEEARSLLNQSLKEILDYAEKVEVKVGVEYEPGLLIENAEELLALIDDIGSDHLGANLDIGHSYLADGDVCRVIRDLGQRIFNLHIEDIKEAKHYHLIPGEGAMNFAEIFETLMNVGYKGFFTVELYTYPDRPEYAALKSYDYLRRLLRGISASLQDSSRDG